MENKSQTNGDALLNGETTILLKQWSGGDRAAFEKLKKHVDAELRRLASHYLNGSKNANILQPTVIVHDFYIRLLQLEKDAGERKLFVWDNRAHFIGFAADAMRRILIDYIRKELAAKRNGGRQVTLDDSYEQNSGMSFERIVEIHEILDELEKFNSEWAKIVVLRFFGGFSFVEIVEILKITEPTARRHSKLAEEWIRERLKN